MIYLISSWTEEHGISEQDYLLNVMKLLQSNKRRYKLILVNYFPFLRYQMQRFHLSYRNFSSLFDLLQGIVTTEGFPLDMDDLNLPDKIEKIYTPNGVALISEGKNYGEVLYNKYGFISHIRYYLETGSLLHSYDDRGFLSSTDYIDENGSLFKREYFNEVGELTLLESFDATPQVTVKKYKELGLPQETYPDVITVLTQLMTLTIGQNKKQKSQFISMTDPYVLQLTRGISKTQSVIQLIPYTTDLTTFTTADLKDLETEQAQLVTDTEEKRDELASLLNKELHPNISVLPIYQTDLALGMSNSVAKLIIYWKVTNGDSFNFEVNQLLMNKLLHNEECSLIIEVSSYEEKLQFMHQQKLLIDDYFQIDSDSEDFAKTEHFIIAKREKRLFTTDAEAVEDLKKTTIWKFLVEAVDAYSRIEYRILPKLVEVKQDMHVARLYIDLTDKPDLQHQSFAVSAGVPQIARRQTAYVQPDKNGHIIQKVTDLDAAADYFLFDLNNWNTALIANLEILERYNSDEIMKKWRKLLHVTKKEN